MNILQIANKAINPPDGGSIAIIGLTKGFLKNNHHVYLLNIETYKHKNNPVPDALLSNQNFKLKGVNLNTKIKFTSLIANLIFSKKPYIAQRFIKNRFITELQNLISNNSFDLIQFEGLYSLQFLNYIPKSFTGKLIYRPHNLEHQIWNKTADESNSFLKRWYYKNMSYRLRKLEKSLLNKYDFIAPISKTDLSYFNQLGNTKPAIVIPFGMETLNLKLSVDNNSNSLCYLGALDWIPNQNGIIWFIENVFPVIIEQLPETKFYIAGRNAPNWFIKKIKTKNVIYYGQVKSAQDFLLSHGPAVVPLFSGSGMRVKIIEAMALKKSIIATNLAAEGISVTNKENILISDDKESFAKNCINLITNKDLQKKIGNNAFDLIKSEYDNAQIVKSLLEFIKTN